MPGFLCFLSPQAGRGKAAWLSLDIAPMRVSPTVAPTSSLRRLPVASAPHMQEVRRDEARHSLIDIRSRADNADIAEFRLRLAREMAQHPCPHIRSRIRNIDAFHYGDARGIDHGVHPGATETSAAVRPVSSASSRMTLPRRSTVSPRTSLGSGVPAGK